MLPYGFCILFSLLGWSHDFMCQLCNHTHHVSPLFPTFPQLRSHHFPHHSFISWHHHLHSSCHQLQHQCYLQPWPSNLTQSMYNLNTGHAGAFVCFFFTFFSWILIIFLIFLPPAATPTLSATAAIKSLSEQQFLGFGWQPQSRHPSDWTVQVCTVFFLSF